MINHVKGTGEVKISYIEVLVVKGCILYVMYEVENVVV